MRDAFWCRAGAFVIPCAQVLERQPRTTTTSTSTPPKRLDIFAHEDTQCPIHFADDDVRNQEQEFIPNIY